MQKSLYRAFIYLMNNLKIRTKIFIFLVVALVFFILLFSFFTFKKMEMVINEESGASMIQVLEQINNNIDYNIRKCEISFNSFYAGGRFNSLIPEAINDYNDMLFYFKAVRNQVSTFKKVNEDITDLRVFSFDDSIPWDNTSIFSAGEISNELWTKSLLHDNWSYRFYWTNIKDETGNKSGYINSIYCYTAVFNEKNLSPLAILRLDVDREKVFSAIKTVAFGKSGVVFAAKDNGDLIYYNPSKKQYLGDFKSKIKSVVLKGENKGAFTATIDGNKEFLVFSKNNKLGWYVIGSIPQKEYEKKTDVIRNFIVLLSVMLCIVGFISTFLFSSLVTKRITRLSNMIDNVAQGDFNAEEDIPGNDEVGQVSHHFKEMVHKIKELVHEVEEQYKKESILLNEKYELEILKKEAELCALQTQINPHFLFNTLEMMKGLLFSEDPKGNIISAIKALSNTFKYNLNAGYIANIKDEVKHIENYLTIHNLRFDRSVQLINEIDETSLNCDIVRFTFEPIIENAIVHGFRNSKTDNYVNLSSKVMDDSLLIFVKDDGAGIPEEKLKEIKSLLLNGEYSFKSDRKGGLGIYNVNGRIKRYFGVKYGIDITSSEGKGTTVIISLPKNGEEQ